MQRYATFSYKQKNAEKNLCAEAFEDVNMLIMRDILGAFVIGGRG